MKRIYAIINPITGDPVYIGQTVKTLGGRLSNHLSASKEGKSNIQKWVKTITSNGGKPGIILIDEVVDNEGDFWESHYIWLYKSWGYNLFNSYDGGIKNQKVISKFDKNVNYFPESCKEIIVLDECNNILFESRSIGDIVLKLNINREKIREVLVGKRNQGNNVWKVVHSYKGYVFVYKNEYDSNKDYTVKRRLVNRGRVDRIVQQFDLNNNLLNEFISTLEAERSTKVGNSEISRCCAGNGKTAGGYIWKYKII